MDLRVTSTGKVFYQFDSQVAAVLCEAFPSVFEPAPKIVLKPQPLVERFGLAQMESGFFVLRRTFGAQVDFFDGYPFEAKRYWPDCPDSVLEEYARRFVVRETVHNHTPAYLREHEKFMESLAK